MSEMPTNTTFAVNLAKSAGNMTTFTKLTPNYNKVKVKLVIKHVYNSKLEG